MAISTHGCDYILAHSREPALPVLYFGARGQEDSITKGTYPTNLQSLRGQLAQYFDVNSEVGRSSKQTRTTIARGAAKGDQLCDTRAGSMLQ